MFCPLLEQIALVLRLRPGAASRVPLGSAGRRGAFSGASRRPANSLADHTHVPSGEKTFCKINTSTLAEVDECKRSPAAAHETFVDFACDLSHKYTP